MQQTKFKIETKLINDMSVQNGRTYESVKEPNKSSKEIRKFFNGFKRAIIFGSFQF